MRQYHTTLWHIGRQTSIIAMLLFAFTFAKAQFVVTPNVTPACHATDGAVTFTFTGGNVSGTHYYYVYQTNGSSNFPQQTTPTFTGMGPGDYQAYIYGADSAAVNFTVPSVISLSSTITNTTCPANTGSIAIVATGGTPAYTYAWSTAGSTATITNLAGNVYGVTVTDAAGCVAIHQDTVVATSPMVASIANNGVVCNPTLTVSQTGGTGTVTYHWNTNQTGTSITNLTYSYTYVVTATDANGCTAVAGTYVNITPLVIDSGFNSVVYPTCLNNNGAITVHQQNGTAPFTFHWSNNATDSAITGLSMGQYDVTVTDAHGCTGNYSYYLYNQNQVGVYIQGYNRPACGQSDGALYPSASGGSGTLTYLWSNGATTSQLTNIPAGNYTVTVTDPGGCSATASQTLTGIGNFTVTVSTTPGSCDTSLHTATATATVSGGGTAPFSYTWYSGYPGNYPNMIGTSATISGLPVNIWIYAAVVDANGCSSSTNINDSIMIQVDPACYDHITGYAYNDANANCTKDAGEAGVAGINVYASNGGQSYWANTDTTGYYDIAVLPGSYTIAEGSNAYGYCVVSSCNSSHTATFSATGLTSSGNDFGQTGSNASDLGVHLGYLGAAPGGTKQYWVYYYNRGSVASASSTTLEFVHDPNITLSSTTPPYTSYNSTTHTISWTVGSVPVSYWDNNQVVSMLFDIPSTLALGTLTTAQAAISPTSGDCNPADNSESYTDTISGSHDPNAKEVSPAGNLLVSDSVLTYTIRFQNTGNAPATRVVIKDTLSSYLDPGTVERGASSHPYKFDLSGNGILTFTFDPIYLPDSVHNVDSSNGFVKYSIHTKRNLALGTQVKNTAYIYFDINPAVVTNTTVNERSDFKTGIKSVGADGAMIVTVSPNPVQDKSRLHITGASGELQFELTDVRGQKVMESRTDDRDIVLDSRMFANGMYLYTVRDAAGNTQSGKVLIAR